MSSNEQPTHTKKRTEGGGREGRKKKRPSYREYEEDA
jgi:hypothetical protein